MRQTRISELTTLKTSEFDFDRGALQLLKRRRSFNTEDDHFDKTALDAKWISFNAVTTELTSLPGWLRLTKANAGLLQAYPAGDWDIETEVYVGQPDAAKYFSCGLTLSTSTDSAACTFCFHGFGQQNNLGVHRFAVEKWINNAWNSTHYYTDPTSFSPQRVALKINKAGTTYTFYYSQYPSAFAEWNRIYTTGALGYTPTYIGLYGNTACYYNYFLRY
jgi:hypothetical protein